MLQRFIDFWLWFFFGRDATQTVSVRVPAGEPRPARVPKTEVLPVPISMKDDEQVTLGPIQPVDKRGRPSTLSGVPTWAVTDAKVLKITPSADGLSAVLAALDVGTAAWTLAVQAGPDGPTITKTDGVAVSAGDVADVQVPVSAPTKQ